MGGDAASSGQGKTARKTGSQRRVYLRSMAFRHDGVRQSRLELSIGTLRRTVSGNVLQIIFQVEKSVFGLQYFEVLYLAEIGLFHPGANIRFTASATPCRPAVATTVKGSRRITLSPVILHDCRSRRSEPAVDGIITAEEQRQHLVIRYPLAHYLRRRSQNVTGIVLQVVQQLDGRHETDVEYHIIELYLRESLHQIPGGHILFPSGP